MKPGHAPPSKARKDDAPGLNVLIADDSAVTRRVMAALVSTILPNFALMEAATGTETRDALRQGGFDVAFLDLHMPGMSPSEAPVLPRHNGLFPCVVLMSDGPGGAADEAASALGAYECLQKPLEEDELRLIFANVQRMREKRRVLVVDDSKSARQLMDKVLRRSRFAMDIETLKSGEDALEALKREGADVVFLDYDMPGIDGLETACLIQEVTPGTRVIMVSASHNPAVERAARYFGAIDFIRKPFYAREVDKGMHIALDLPLTSLMVDAEPQPEERPDEDGALEAALAEDAPDGADAAIAAESAGMSP